MRKPLAILGTLTLAAVTAVVASQAPQWFSQVGDNAEQLDSLRTDPEIRTTVSKIWLNDEGRTMATREGQSPGEALISSLEQQGAGADEKVLGGIESMGGIRVENLSLQIILEGRRNRQIRITNVTPRIINRNEALGGTLFYMPAQGGDESLRMLIDLDEQRPAAREAVLNETSLEWESGGPYFDSNTISLKDSEQQVVVLRVKTKRSHIIFSILVTYVIGGETKTLEIDDAGKPFEVTAMHQGATEETYSYEHVYSLRGDFSLCEMASPDRFSEFDAAC
jgi:hypothetical protein